MSGERTNRGIEIFQKKEELIATAERLSSNRSEHPQVTVASHLAEKILKWTETRGLDISPEDIQLVFGSYPNRLRYVEVILPNDTRIRLTAPKSTKSKKSVWQIPIKEGDKTVWNDTGHPDDYLFKQLKERRQTNRKTARLMIAGKFSKEDIISPLTKEEYKPNDQIKAQMKDRWPGWPRVDLQAGLNPSGIKLDDETGKITLKFKPTDGIQYYGSNHLEDLDQFGIENLANPLSCGTLVITKDGYILLAIKEEGDAIGSLDAIGGYVSLGKRITKDGAATEDLSGTDVVTRGEGAEDTVNIFATSLREVAEELGIIDIEHAVKDHYLLGIGYEYASQGKPEGLCHPVAAFALRLDLTLDEVKQMKGDGEISVLPVQTSNPKADEYISKAIAPHQASSEPDGEFVMGLGLQFAAAEGWIQTQRSPEKIAQAGKKFETKRDFRQPVKPAIKI